MASSVYDSSMCMGAVDGFSSFVRHTVEHLIENVIDKFHFSFDCDAIAWALFLGGICRDADCLLLGNLNPVACSSFAIHMKRARVLR